MGTSQNLEVQIEGKVVLSGTLTLPTSSKEGKYPAVLIIAGSGNLNRDGNDKRGKLQLNLYRELAEFISSLGIITLRYDKRGIGKSSGNFLEAGMWDLVDDAEAAVEFLCNHPRVDKNKVFVLGHSEGAILATALNARNPVSGLILLSGAGAKLDETMKMQQQLVYSDLDNMTGFKGTLIKKLKLTDKIRKRNEKFFNKVLTSVKDVMRIYFVRMNSKWLREHFSYDLFEDYKKITCPVLAITGKKDVQVDYRKLEVLANYIESPLETYTIDDMNHGLKEQKEDNSILDVKKVYIQDIGKQLHPKLREILSTWLKGKISEN